MSSVAESALLDWLLHFPEALDKRILPRAAHDAGSGNRGHGAEEKTAGPPVDIMETSKAYAFYLDVPGIPKSDIQVCLEDEKVLVVKSNGKRKREEGEEEGCKYLRLERKGTLKFLRNFRLPDDANPAAITAKCENGVLTVIVEKLPPPPEAKPKTVQVAVA